MKLIKLTLPIILATSLYANPESETQSDPHSDSQLDKHSVSLTGLAYSKHKAKGLNESHNWKGIQYSYLYSESLSLKARVRELY